MAKVITDEQNYQDIANAIRAKLGSTDTYTPSEMAAAISTISGGGGTAITDPEVVYLATRPSDWLKMPTPNNNEGYVLLQIDDGYSGPLHIYFELGGSSSSLVEFGTVDQNGTFIADSSLTYQATSYQITTSVPNSSFGSLTAGGKRQIMMKISNCVFAQFNLVPNNSAPVRTAIAEISVKPTSTNVYSFLGSGNSGYAVPNLRYLTVSGGTYASYASYICANLKGLIAIRSLPSISQITTLKDAFNGCSNLVAVPPLSTSHITNFSGAFSGTRVPNIPAYDFSNATDMSNAFAYCKNLSSVSITLNSATTVSGMFNYATTLTEATVNAPQATNWGTLFNYCYAIKKITLNMPSATTANSLLSIGGGVPISQMDISGINTSHITTFGTSGFPISSFPKEMWPSIDTSSGTSFSSALGTGSMYAGEYVDLSIFDFSSATSTSSLNYLIGVGAGTQLILGDTFSPSGIPSTGTVVSANSSSYWGVTSNNPAHIKINKTDAMLQLAANATTVFSSSSYVYVYVPDNLLATYQADQYWSTLGARLKGFSEWPS